MEINKMKDKLSKSQSCEIISILYAILATQANGILQIIFIIFAVENLIESIVFAYIFAYKFNHNGDKR